MTNEAKEASFAERIDNDSGLKTKARMLTITSLLLMTVMVTGATIEEANTFIFKVVILNQAGVPAMMVIAIIFLMVRYYSYAKPYHAEVEGIWHEKLLSDPFCFKYDEQYQEPYGLIYELQPSPCVVDGPDSEPEQLDFNQHSYRRGLLFGRYMDYEGNAQGEHVAVSVDLRKRLPGKTFSKLLILEFKYRIQTLLDNREYLDILGPYFIGLAALVSFFWRDDVQALLKTIPTN